MSKIIAFVGSNSATSINEKLLNYAVNHTQLEVLTIDLKRLEVPMYSETEENSNGIPKDISTLKADIEDASALIVAVNEHNGTMSAFFKNITDWLSRTDSQYLKHKPIFLLSTSPGQGGAQSSLNYTEENFKKFGGNVVHKFSLPSFGDNFKDSEMEKTHKEHLKSLLTNFENDL